MRSLTMLQNGKMYSKISPHECLGAEGEKVLLQALKTSPTSTVINSLLAVYFLCS